METMTNEQKAREIERKRSMYFNDLQGAALDMAEWKDKQPITELRGWHTQNPIIDCYVLLKTVEFPKNCEYIVAEWDNDAKCFYSESSDFSINKWEKWKMIEENKFLSKFQI